MTTRPRSSFDVTDSAHLPPCQGCEACAHSAIAMARATGSTGATYSDGSHSATVTRTTRQEQ